MAKRSLFSPISSPAATVKAEDIEMSPSKVTKTDSHATVSGLMSTLSQLQPNRYFHGELTDGETIMRVVGFDKSKLAQLQAFCDNGQPVTLRDCSIQRNKMKDTLEIVLKTHTKIERSTLNFDISDPKTVGSLCVNLDQLASLAEHTRVTVRGTVTKVHTPLRVGQKRVLKQDITIADQTATATITLWEKHVGSIDLDCTYQFNRLETCTYKGKVYLSFPSIVSFDKIEPIVGLSTTEPPSSSDEEEDMTCATVSGVKELDTFYGCLSCGKAIMPLPPHEKQIGVCEQCKITQKLSPKQTAKLTVECGTTKVTLKAFDEIIKNIAQSDTKVSEPDLLLAPSFDLSYNKFNIITKVSRN